MNDISQSKENDKRFVVKKISHISSLKEGDILPESSLCLQDGDRIVQFDYVRENKEAKKVELKPGVFDVVSTNHGIDIEPVSFKERRILTSYDNSAKIIAEAKNFFAQKAVYDFLDKKPMKRAVMLYSPPGYGKSSAIVKLSKELTQEDPGTIVINWPTSEVDARDMSRFLTSRSKYANNTTRLVLIIEDIGGGEREDSDSIRSVDSGLLNLLDGVGVTFAIPTFIIATTNHPGNLLESLADRPERFDEFIELSPPTFEERIELIKFIGKRSELNAEELDAIKKAENFSVAHLSEVVTRSLIKNKTYAEVINEIIQHRARYSRNFEKYKPGIKLS